MTSVMAQVLMICQNFPSWYSFSSIFLGLPFMSALFLWTCMIFMNYLPSNYNLYWNSLDDCTTEIGNEPSNLICIFFTVTNR